MAIVAASIGATAPGKKFTRLALTGCPMRLGVAAYDCRNTLLVALANDVIAERSNVRVVGLRRI